MRPPSSDTASAAPAVALSRREQRRLGALGHHLAQWREALELLRRRPEKGELPAASREHIGACLALLPASSEVTRREVGVLIEHKPEARWCATIAAVGDTAEISAAARALLHLPALRRTWAIWLRASVLASLRQRLGVAWMADPADLPCHAAIQGLGLACWADFWRLADSGRRFRVSFAGDPAPLVLETQSEAADWQAAAARLGACGLGGALVEELPGADWQAAQAVFERMDGRWEMTAIAPVE